MFEKLLIASGICLFWPVTVQTLSTYNHFCQPCMLKSCLSFFCFFFFLFVFRIDVSIFDFLISSKKFLLSLFFVACFELYWIWQVCWSLYVRFKSWLAILSSFVVIVVVSDSISTFSSLSPVLIDVVWKRSSQIDPLHLLKKKQTQFFF